MTKRIQKAIDILLDSLSNGTLAKGTCKACAVGNLVASAVGAKINVPKTLDEHNIIEEYEHWAGCLWDKSNWDPNKGKELIASTNFSIEELRKIERAFERNTIYDFLHHSYIPKDLIREDQIKGLKAVVDVMLTFDECKESTQEVFTSKAELIPICQ